eukprot:4170073-Amphidinium_carterae.1
MVRSSRLPLAKNGGENTICTPQRNHPKHWLLIQDCDKAWFLNPVDKLFGLSCRDRILASYGNRDIRKRWKSMGPAILND